LSEPIIQVENLKKSFKVPKKKESKGFFSKARNIFYREWEEIDVLRDLSFEIQEGDFIGYIGANGAGKSTTIKLLTGILAAESGKVQCLGFDPYQQRYDYSYHIGVVFGQKSILEYEVPVQASFDLYRKIYEMDDTSYKKRLGFYQDILGIEDLLHIPVRKLSFGQRMRCEVAASLLHQPKIVFLDEPTIGLDASAKKEIREFLKTVNEVDKTTIILTTHDMKDIEQLCKRVMMIDRGSIIYDGDLEQLKRNYLKEKTLRISPQEILHPEKYKELRDKTESILVTGDIEHWQLSTDKIQLGNFIRELLECVTFSDLNVTEPELEDIVRHIYEVGLNV